jgi:hypothetical protein
VLYRTPYLPVYSPMSGNVSAFLNVSIHRSESEHYLLFSRIAVCKPAGVAKS